MQYRLGRYRGVWCVIWRDPSKGTQRRSLGLEASQENRPAAEAAVAEFAADRRRDAARPSGIVTIEAILDGYHQSKPDQSVRPSLYSYFGNWTIAAIDKAACETYATKRTGAGASRATVHTELGLLRTALLWAAKAKWIPEAPEIERPGRGEPRDRWLTSDEARRLIAAATARHMKLFIQIALHTGARKGAILGLTWDRVSLDLGRIEFKEPGLETGRKRRPMVAVHPDLLESLRAAHAIRTSDYVIEWAGERVQNVKHGFSEACQRAGLSDVTPHTLRHTAATWAAQGGAPMWEIAGMLGHASVTVTEQVYAKHHPDYQRQAVSAIADRLRDTQCSLGSNEPATVNKGRKNG